MKKPDNVYKWIGRRVVISNCFGMLAGAGKIVSVGPLPDHDPCVLLDDDANRCTSNDGSWLVAWGWIEPEPAIPLYPLDALMTATGASLRYGQQERDDFMYQEMCRAHHEQVRQAYEYWLTNYNPLAKDSKMSNEKWGSECDELRRFNDAEMEVLEDNPDALAFLRVLTYKSNGCIRNDHPVWQKFLRRMAMADKELIADCHEYIKKAEKDTSK